MGDVLKKRARGARWRGMEVIVRSMVGVVSIQVLRRIDVVEQFVGTEDMRGGFFFSCPAWCGTVCVVGRREKVKAHQSQS